MTGPLPRALALVETDLRASRRAMRSIPGGEWLAGVVSAALAAAVVVLGVATGAIVHGWSAQHPSAAAGALDATLAALFAAALLAPVLGGASDRVRSLAHASRAEVDGRVLLAATTLREVICAPLAPVLAAALGAGVGATVHRGAGPVVHAVVVVLALAAFALTAGAWSAAWIAAQPRVRALRPLLALLVVAAVAALAGGGLASGSDDVGRWLAGVHAARGSAALLPHGWAAAALHDGGSAGVWAPVGLLALAAWAAVAASRCVPFGVRAAGPAPGGRPARPWPPLRGRFGALVAKDLTLLRRDSAIRAAVVRHGAPVALVVVAVVAFAWTARTDAVAAARAVRWVPRLGALGVLFAVALSGVTALLPGLDRGGIGQMAAVPVRVRDRLLARAVAWTLCAAPALALLGAGATLVTAALLGVAPWEAASVAAVEGAACACAGAGAGLLFGVLRPSAGSRAPDDSAGGVLAGLAAASLTLLAAAPVVIVAHALPAVGGALAAAFAGLGVGLSATLAAARLAQARDEARSA